MFAIGASLREARTRRGLTPEDVQKGLRIRERYLTALEEERWDVLPGEAYIKGFLRTYAEFLGLNGNLYIDEYNSRSVDRGDEPPLVPESLAPGRARRGTFRMLGLTLAVLAAVGGLAAWKLGASTGTAKSPPIRAGDAVAAATPQPAVRPAPVVKPAPALAAKPLPTVALLSATRGRSWISVRVGDANGKVIYEGMLEQGKTLRFGVEQKLWVRMGRPWLLDVRVAGRTVGGLPAEPANLLLTRTGAEAA
jgi:hypothetical protein